MLRSELQGETGAWPVHPAATWSSAAAADSHSTDQDASVVDLAARRKRTGDTDPAIGTRRLPKPRRIGERSNTGENTRDQDEYSESPPTNTRTGRHRK
ncbi:hypothetical protein GV791_03750 [Nocardia cyriacigeorgica]|uniref:Uncharacterized protein n=1 Tax=Nocardia cyriacigeorgica TaxID=135487 RepID=A0A6P1CGF6_9NOCA|nr:hypothetical protein [Nocardia cyriacigeorgica]NEW31679.1 hypothetical protein [Nocardia cyriacigeorgica]BDT89351.1 hypothetical protein FMUAM8_51150 [Nocardia cyriacigeorgica]BDU08743.1 hypothetical protein FMUBM48_50060 [Nocardia cyriacigeorgica]